MAKELISLKKYYKDNCMNKEELIGRWVYDTWNDEFVYIKEVEGGLWCGKNDDDDNGHFYDMSRLEIHV